MKDKNKRIPLGDIPRDVIDRANDALRDWQQAVDYRDEGGGGDIGICGDTGEWTIAEIEEMERRYRDDANSERARRKRNETAHLW